MNQISRVRFVARVATDLWPHMVTFSTLLIAFYPKAASFSLRIYSSNSKSKELFPYLSSYPDQPK